MTEPAIPKPFEDLAPFVDWALETERARTEKKVGASMDEIRAFHDAVLPRLDEMIDHLDGFSVGEMPAPEHRLYLMTLSLVEVASLVEQYKQREVIEACDPLRFESQF